MNQFPEQVLLQLVENVKSLLHPSVVERTFLDIGATLGREVITRVSEPPDTLSSTKQMHYLRYSEWMRTHWGWDQTMSIGTGDHIEVHCRACPFERLAKEDSLICQLEGAILGELAGKLFGYSKVVVQRDQSHPPRNCRFLVHTERTPQSQAATGLTFASNRSEGKRTSDQAAASRILAQLTARERQIIALLAEGLPDKQIAKTLHLSVRTVEGHLSRIRQKTALQTRSALIRFALCAGTI
ncbi:MAG: helix-turn-helix transcriptional regulator [Nitrospira sp.]|nr:helix-turn-helix transcriptional regulator [Nitrospira sp.]